jgi:hypothetical protein
MKELEKEYLKAVKSEDRISLARQRAKLWVDHGIEPHVLEDLENEYNKASDEDEYQKEYYAV